MHVVLLERFIFEHVNYIFVAGGTTEASIWFRHTCMIYTTIEYKNFGLCHWPMIHINITDLHKTIVLNVAL